MKMICITRLLSLIIILFIFIPVNALQKLTLNQAIDIALKNNFELLTAQQRLKQANEIIYQVWGMLYPALESEADAIRQYAENGFLSLSDGQYDLKFIQIKFGINPGNFYNTLTQSYSNYKLAKEDVKKITSTIEYNVIKSYFDVILADEVNIT